MKFISLFAGIGGIDLGLERAGMSCVAQVEIDPFCQKVLARHWPLVPRFSDVRTFNRSQLDQHVDLIAGGFPCQDISVAGKGVGLSGTRSGLWWEYLRILKEFRPRWVLAENVPALRTRGADEVLSSLEELGYSCWPTVVGAWSVGALHKRDRVWIIASRTHTDSNTRNGIASKPVSDTGSLRLQGKREGPSRPWSWEQFTGLVQAALRISLPAGKYGGVSDGVPCRMDRLKSLGNSAVPQVVELMGQAILNGGVQ